MPKTMQTVETEAQRATAPRNPYLIEGPAQISFSGGRSSGMMLCKIVEAYGGRLPGNVFVVFANTGKEREETLLFVDKLARHLDITVHWIEYLPTLPQKDAWKEVTFSTASRKGEPFAQMIDRRGYPPNPVGRICTAFLKLKPMDGYMRAAGWPDFVRVAGIRADEPRRVAKMRGRDDVDFVLPLADAGATKEDVAAFWKAMPFDLGLPGVNGETMAGNCDLCYLKTPQKIIGLMREDPSRADWWIEQETKTGKLFRIDRPNYAALKVIAQQPQLFDLPDEDALPCECVD
jgi:3'-phosphoadenosine 5'-phosphosulfate sulfotransferase (PAPS reductase)/FAD synthetase